VKTTKKTAGPRTKVIRSLGGKKLVDEIVEAALVKKAERITVLDMGGASSLCDWMVICQGDNPFQCKAIANSIIDEHVEKKTKPYLVEGLPEGRWVIVDFSDVLVHVFTRELRRYYAIEELWPAVGRTEIAEE
jgi:ribosome-associated protein